MPLSNDSQLTVEKTPSYFITPGAAERIYRMSPTTKLIVVVRDPVTRAISDYTQALSKRRPRLPAFEQLALTRNNSSSSSRSDEKTVNVSWGAIRIGLYARHLEQWLRFFPRHQIHFVNGERLITDPTSEMTSLQDFLHLPRVIRREYFYYTSAKKGFPCLIRKSPSGHPRNPANQTSTPVLHCLGKTKGRQHPIIDAGVIEKLRDFFRPWNRMFYRMVGTDFGWS